LEAQAHRGLSLPMEGASPSQPLPTIPALRTKPKFYARAVTLHRTLASTEPVDRKRLGNRRTGATEGTYLAGENSERRRRQGLKFGHTEVKADHLVCACMERAGDLPAQTEEARKQLGTAGVAPDKSIPIRMVDTVTSVGAMHFDLTIRNIDGEKRGFRPSQSVAQIKTSLPKSFAGAAARQNNIIIRALSEEAHFVQLDDLDSEALKRDRGGGVSDPNYQPQQSSGTLIVILTVRNDQG
jgi:hypothetical protein